MKMFIVVLSTIFSSTAFAKSWYYRCVGQVSINPKVTVVQLGPNNAMCNVDNSRKFTSVTQRKDAIESLVRQNVSYSFEFAGKTDIINGERIKVSGLCKKWSNFSSLCSYAVDEDNKDLKCSDETLGLYIVTE